MLRDFQFYEDEILRMCHEIEMEVIDAFNGRTDVGVDGNAECGNEDTRRRILRSNAGQGDPCRNDEMKCHVKSGHANVGAENRDHHANIAVPINILSTEAASKPRPADRCGDSDSEIIGRKREVYKEAEPGKRRRAHPEHKECVSPLIIESCTHPSASHLTLEADATATGETNVIGPTGIEGTAKINNQSMEGESRIGEDGGVKLSMDVTLKVVNPGCKLGGRETERRKKTSAALAGGANEQTSVVSCVELRAKGINGCEAKAGGCDQTNIVVNTAPIGPNMCFKDGRTTQEINDDLNKALLELKKEFTSQTHSEGGARDPSKRNLNGGQNGGNFPDGTSLIRTAMINNLQCLGFRKPEGAFNANLFKPKTIIPEINSDSEDSAESAFPKQPAWVRTIHLDDKLKKQDHNVLTEYFRNPNILNIVSMFPNVKDLKNESPNKMPSNQSRQM